MSGGSGTSVSVGARRSTDLAARCLNREFNQTDTTVSPVKIQNTVNRLGRLLQGEQLPRRTVGGRHEAAPRHVIEASPVGLDRVRDLLVRLAVLVDQLDRSPEEIEPHHRRLAALPCDHHLGRLVRLEQLLDVGLEKFIGHPEAVAGIQHLLGEEEAVFAVEIADRSGWLGQHVVGRWSALHRQHRIFRCPS